MANFAAVEGDVDELRLGRETRGSQEREHRVGTRADHEDHVCGTKGGRARRRERARMVFGDDAAALRRGEEWDSSGLDELAQFVLGTGPQHAAAGEYQRLASAEEQFDRFAHERGIAGGARLSA